MSTFPEIENDDGVQAMESISSRFVDHDDRVTVN
jgi:hypothetical protein